MMWEIRWQFLNVLLLVNESILYYSIQLGRCTLLSVGVLALVMSLRGTVLRKAVFLKGMLWGLFLAGRFIQTGKRYILSGKQWIRYFRNIK